MEEVKDESYLRQGPPGHTAVKPGAAGPGLEELVSAPRSPPPEGQAPGAWGHSPVPPKQEVCPQPRRRPQAAALRPPRPAPPAPAGPAAPAPGPRRAAWTRAQPRSTAGRGRGAARPLLRGVGEPWAEEAEGAPRAPGRTGSADAAVQCARRLPGRDGARQADPAGAREVGQGWGAGTAPSGAGRGQRAAPARAARARGPATQPGWTSARPPSAARGGAGAWPASPAPWRARDRAAGAGRPRVRALSVRPRSGARGLLRRWAPWPSAPFPPPAIARRGPRGVAAVKDAQTGGGPGLGGAGGDARRAGPRAAAGRGRARGPGRGAGSGSPGASGLFPEAPGAAPRTKRLCSARAAGSGRSAPPGPGAQKGAGSPGAPPRLRRRAPRRRASRCERCSRGAFGSRRASSTPVCAGSHRSQARAWQPSPPAARSWPPTTTTGAAWVPLPVTAPVEVLSTLGKPSPTTLVSPRPTRVTGGQASFLGSLLSHSWPQCWSPQSTRNLLRPPAA